MLYMVTDQGVAACVDVKNGKEVKQDRLGGNFSASPLYGDGKIYFASQEGSTYVVERAAS